MHLLRWMYAGGRPNRLARLLNRGSARLFGAGIGPRRAATLEVLGRRSGRTFALPVVVTTWKGERYLVSMLGERVAWVANVRAADGRAVLRHGEREAVVLEDVPVADRPAILRQYLEDAPGARPHIPVARGAPLEAFAQVADSYPVFRVRSAEGYSLVSS